MLGELGPGLEEAHTPFSAARSKISSTPSTPWSRRARSGSASARSSRPPSARSTSRTRGSSSSLRRASGSRKSNRSTATSAQALSFADVEQRLETLVAHEERLAAACENATRALETVWTQIQQLREQEKRISTHLDQLRESLQTDRGRLTSLEALQEAALGKSTEQVNRWLAGADARRAAPLGAGPRRRERLGTSRRDRARARICKPWASRASTASPARWPTSRKAA